MTTYTEKELSLLKTIASFSLRDGYFPPPWHTVYESFYIRDKKEFHDLIISLEQKKLIKVAKGKLRGIFITETGYDVIIPKLKAS